MTDQRTAVLPRAVAELFEHLTRALHSEGFSEGLNPAQWNALRYLARANRDARTVSAFAQHHMTKKSTASQTFASLVRKKLVSRQPDDEDGRVVRLDLTAKGRGLLDRDPIRLLVAGLERLSTNDLHSTARVLEGITRTVYALRHGETERQD